MSLLTRKPRVTEARSVHAFTHVGRKGTESLPKQGLDSPQWREWIRCKPEAIANDMIAGLAAHRAFREAGGPGLFRFTRSVEVIVYLFDPAVHKQRHGHPLEAQRVIYKFAPEN
jgi:hypothetical protein